SGQATREGWIFALFLVFWMVVAPSYGLCNSLAMRNLEVPHRQFGRVRLWGTIGWMAVGWLVSLVMTFTGAGHSGAGAYPAFLIATLLSVFAAAYCLTLPNTPPLARSGSRGAAWQEGLGLIRQPDVLVFLATSFGVYLTTPLAYQIIPGYLESRGL